MNSENKTTSAHNSPLTGRVEMELRPCICGDGHSRIEDCTVDDPSWLIICDDCGMMIEGETRDDAIRNWNEWEVRDLISKWMAGAVAERDAVRLDLSRAQERLKESVGILHDWAACLSQDFPTPEDAIAALRVLTVKTDAFIHRLATEDAKPSPEREGAKT